MTLRAVLIGTAIAVLLVLVFGPTTVALVTGRPLVVECRAGVEPAACDEFKRDHLTGGGTASGLGFPITWWVLETGTCSDHTWGYWWPFFDPFAMTVIRFC